MKIPPTIELNTVPAILTIILLAASAFFFGRANGIDYCLQGLGLLGVGL